MGKESKNYTLGRGKLYFSRFKANTQVPEGFFYIGNTPAFALTIESQNLDHFSSDEGIREKDQSVPLEVNRTGSLTTDQIVPRNVALFFFGDDSSVTQLAAGPYTETIAVVEKETYFQLGLSDTNPSGLRGLTNVSVYTTGATSATGTLTFTTAGADGDTVTIGTKTYRLKSALAAINDVKIGATATDTALALVKAIMASGVAGTDYFAGTVKNTQVTATNVAGVVTLTAIAKGTIGNAIATTEVGTGTAFTNATLTTGTGTGFVEGTDYTIDTAQGFLKITELSSIAPGSSPVVAYSVAASTRDQVISGSEPVAGALKYVAQNPAGAQFDYYMPYVKISPNGDYALKGDEWQQLPFNLEILAPDVGEAILMDGRPFLT